MFEPFANSGDPDQTPRSAASDLCLHCLPVTRLGSPVFNGLNMLLCFLFLWFLQRSVNCAPNTHLIEYPKFADSDQYTHQCSLNRLCTNIIRIPPNRNWPYDVNVCGHRGSRSACAPTQTDQDLHFSLIEPEKSKHYVTDQCWPWSICPGCRLIQVYAGFVYTIEFSLNELSIA